MRPFEGFRNFDQLPSALLRTEIDCRADRDGSHVPRLVDRSEQHLVVRVRVGQQLVVVQLDDERYLMRVFAGHCAEVAERRSYGVAAPFDCQFDDVFRVEIDRVRSERRAGRVFDVLIDRQDRHVARAGQPAVAEQRLQAAQRADVAVGRNPCPVDRVRRRDVDQRLVDRPANVIQVILGFVSQ